MLPDKISEVLPPGNGFIRSYVEYASQCSDAPEIYHVGVGLTIFSGAVAKYLACPWMAGRILVPNLYTLLVGPSRSSRKTGSMDTGIDILQHVSNELIIPIPGSYEEMITQIRSTPSGLLTYREFSHFLKTTQRGYGEPIRTVLMDLYDWPPDRAYTRNLKKGKTVIEPPICLSMLSSIATELLFSYIDQEDWIGGFFGRMVILYGIRETFRMPLTWQDARTHLASLLSQYSNWRPPACGGFDPYAWQLFTQWSQWRDSQTSTAPSRVTTFISGASTFAAKVALLYAYDSGEPLAGQGWLISYESIRRAILFVDNLYIPSIIHLGERLALGPWEKDRQRVLDVLDTKPEGILQKDLLKRARISLDLLEQVMTTLKAEGTATQSQTAAGIVYRRVPEGKVIQFPNGQVGTSIGSGTA